MNTLAARLSAIALLTMTHAVDAAVIQIFNTGVNASAVVLADGTVGDPHYSLISVPGGTNTVLVASSASGFPIGPWLGDNSLSRWIGPNATSLDGLAGNYTFRTTFDLTGLNASSASLSFIWSVDNSGTDVLLNGVSTGITNGIGFGSFSSLQTISSGFTSGLNTLDFVVNNGGGPIGLRVEISGTADAVPEPATLALLGLGLAGLGFSRRR